MGNCCSQDTAPPPTRKEQPRKTELRQEEEETKKEEPEPVETKDVDVKIKEEKKPVDNGEKQSSPPPSKKPAGKEKRKTSVSREIKIKEKERPVSEEYEHRPQKRAAGWDPENAEDSCKEKDITDGKKVCFLMWKKDNSKLAFFNNTDNLQITMNIKLPECVMRPSVEAAEALGVTPPTYSEETEFYSATLFPGETVPVAEGIDDHTWTGAYSLSYCTGAVTDEEYMKKVAAKVATKLEDDYQLMRAIAEEKNINVSSIPPAYALDYDYKINHALADSVLDHPSRDNDTQFVDMSFPPTDSSVNVQGRPKCWVKPSNYLPPGLEPALFVKGTDSSAISPGDIDQGVLGDCWFMAALAACAEFPADLIIPLFKENAEVVKYSEANVYHIRLAKNGWVNWYVVDGYLPCHAVPQPTGPCFAHNKEQPNELWVSLIEKAYAKIHGNYDNISSGDPAVGLSDLTGYPSRAIDLSADTASVFNLLQYHDEQKHCIFITSPGVDTTLNGATNGEDEAKAKAYAEQGLVSGHAYTILQVYAWEKSPGEVYQIAKVRNPWGTGKEWTGSFRDDDPVWTGTDEATKTLLDATGKDGEGTAQNDGTWWMEIKDAQRMFGHCGACFVNLDWWDVRVKTGLTQNMPRHIIELSPDRDMDALAWVVQPHKRGLPEGDPRLNYSALRVEVVKMDEDGSKTVPVALSNNGVFMYAHSVEAFEVGVECDFDGYFQLMGGEKYFVILRGHPGEECEYSSNRADLVLAYMTSQPCNTRILTPTSATIESFSYASNHGFTVEGCEDVSATCETQVNKSSGGASVPWTNMSRHAVKPQTWVQSPSRTPTHRKSVV
eukprot:TRINITY_DN10936_c2_g1_i2.p1 TRINITY_DN10936_c2_g1~~TRINITY_DN10936_c2_g1_i2.p1  ORF type:complete len:835 (+),score=175.50 TRINITY_DN10936_c2_g1_i2:85-2589(+)